MNIIAAGHSELVYKTVYSILHLIYPVKISFIFKISQMFALSFNSEGKGRKTLLSKLIQLFIHRLREREAESSRDEINIACSQAFAVILFSLRDL